MNLKSVSLVLRKNNHNSSSNFEVNEEVFKRYIEMILFAKSTKELEEIKVNLLGKNGLVTNEFKNLSSAPVEEKKSFGEILNVIKNDLNEKFTEKFLVLTKQEIEKKIMNEYVDVTTPTVSYSLGKKHILTKLMDDLISYFRSLGFEIIRGPVLENEFNNFDGLNVESHHPARQEQDTFFIKNYNSRLLRTHTSNMQVRSYLKNEFPIRKVSIGSVFRNDDFDSTHTPMFHQIEGFVVEDNVNFSHLKGTLLKFLSFLFDEDLCGKEKSNEKIPVRFRPSFFPFTEPSVEVDVCCRKDNDELKIDLNGSWMEILGAGMVNEAVFKKCGIKKNVSGFAFGMGIERLAMLRYGVTDIRDFFVGDIRWLNHYGVSGNI